MQSSKLLGLLIPSFFVFACGSTALLDSSDDMRQPGGAAGSPQNTGDCSACFESSCAWQTAQCEGDPRCATWLAEVRACPADSSQQPSQSCIALVSSPDTPNGKLTSDALRACLSSSGTCCGSATKVDDGGADPKDVGSIDVGAEASLSDSSIVGTPTCEACVYKFKADGKDTVCGTAVRDCWNAASTQGQCREFMLGYFACFPDPNAMGTAAKNSECLMILANKVTPAAQVQFMSSVLGCKEANAGFVDIFSACKNSCIPSARRDCMTCQNEFCPDVMDAYLNDADAQKLMWCREAANGDANKLEKCNVSYAAGAKVLKAVAQCSQASCPVCK